MLPVQFVDEAIDIGFGHYDLSVRLPIVLLCSLILASSWPAARTGVDEDLSFLGKAERVGDGIDLFRVDGERAFVAPGEQARPAAPRSLRLLRLDPARVRLASPLAGSEVPARATVPDIARRSGAVAAVNAGFFSPTGDPNGLLKIDGRLLSDTGRARGAVALFDRAGRLDGHFESGQRSPAAAVSRRHWMADGATRWRRHHPRSRASRALHPGIGLVHRHAGRPGVDARRRSASRASDHDRRQCAHPTHWFRALVWRAGDSAGTHRTHPRASRPGT